MDTRDALILIQQEYICELETLPRRIAEWYETLLPLMKRLRLNPDNGALHSEILQHIRDSPYMPMISNKQFEGLLGYVYTPVRVLSDLYEALMCARVCGGTRVKLTEVQNIYMHKMILSSYWFRGMLMDANEGDDTNEGHVNLYDLRELIGHPRQVDQEGCSHTGLCDTCYHVLLNIEDPEYYICYYHVPDAYFQRLRDNDSPLQMYIPYWERKNAYIREHDIDLIITRSYCDAQ